MISKHITTVIGVSSFCLGIWLDRKYKEFNTIYKIPGFKIFDAVNADSVINYNQQQIIYHEQRISEVRYLHINIFYVICMLFLKFKFKFKYNLLSKYFLDNKIWFSKFG